MRVGTYPIGYGHQRYYSHGRTPWVYQWPGYAYPASGARGGLGSSQRPGGLGAVLTPDQQYTSYVYGGPPAHALQGVLPGELVKHGRSGLGLSLFPPETFLDKAVLAGILLLVYKFYTAETEGAGRRALTQGYYRAAIKHGKRGYRKARVAFKRRRR